MKKSSEKTDGKKNENPQKSEQKSFPHVNQKQLRCEKFGANIISTLEEKKPNSFAQNSSKEELVLEHVLEYHKQFGIIYDPNKPLLLAPKNECGILKFICTTLRPTKLPYENMYSWESCAKFIANFLAYEELDPPNMLPAFIPAPSNVLKWQAGDCFDFSIVLCSLLLGNGYDCFVVYGHAPRVITTRDESLLECPEIDLPVLPSDVEESIKPEIVKEEKKVDKNELLLDPVQQMISIIETERAKKLEEEKEKIRIAETVIDDDEPDMEKYDTLEGQRIHAWILVRKGKRGINESFFIEPSTCRKYEINNSPYLNVECIFNNKNFWINMCPKLPISQLNFDGFDSIKNLPAEWEYVMITSAEKKTVDNGEGEVAENAENQTEVDDNMEEVLDMPPPWAPMLEIDRDAFDYICPLGEKTVFYKRKKLDIYAPYSQPDGLVCRITFFHDYKRHIIDEIRSFFEHRKDKLVLRRRFPYEFKTIEEYAPGKKLLTNNKTESHLKKLIEFDGELRELFYYPHRNNDGLIYRKEKIGKKTIEKYKEREDKINFRSVSFILKGDEDTRDFTMDDNHCGKVIITKMVEKFDLDPKIPANKQFKKVVFKFTGDRQIYQYFHYPVGSITNVPKCFARDSHYSSKQAETHEKDSSKNANIQEKQKAFQMEKDCHGQIKQQEAAAKVELEERYSSETKISQYRVETTEIGKSNSTIIEKSLFDKAREKAKLGPKKQEEELKQAVEKDYLAPVFEKLKIRPNIPLTIEQAMAVRDHCLLMARERLLARADIIQKRMDAEQGELDKQYSSLHGKSGETLNKAEEEKYERDFTTANFRIEILTERAIQHFHNALKKFEELGRKLEEDPRLGVLKQVKS